jgi:hypothetical protein
MQRAGAFWSPAAAPSTKQGLFSSCWARAGAEAAITVCKRGPRPQGATWEPYSASLAATLENFARRNDERQAQEVCSAS